MPCRSSYEIETLSIVTIFGFGEIGMVMSTEDVEIYFLTIPAHKFMHIKKL